MVGQMNARMPQSLLPETHSFGFAHLQFHLQKKKKKNQFNKNIDFLFPWGFLVLVCYK